MAAFEFNLAGNGSDVNKLRFPLLASPKIDGVRGGVRDGRLLARSLKLIPNRYTQDLFGRFALEGLDGELAVGKVTDPNCFNNTSGALMRVDGEPLVSFNIFDCTHLPDHLPFDQRLMVAKRLIAGAKMDGNELRLIEHRMVRSVDELLAWEGVCLNRGYEGLVLRDPKAPRKNGRSTTNEGGLLRFTRTVRGEALVIGVEEGEENTNDKTLESKGRAKRSSHKAGKVPNGMLGAFIVKDVATGIEFNIGTGQGLTIQLRKHLWGQRKKLIGKLVTYEAKATGKKLKPRQPIWIGFRDRKDL